MRSTSRGACCIAGGGPAGMMLGYLLARAGIEVLVLEKHADFLRDFRGDTIHPSTLEVMHELGVLEQLLSRPHQKTHRARARIGGREILLGDMKYLRTRCRYVAMMPQWDFLDFLAEQASRYPTFHLGMQAEITGLTEEDGRIAGVRAKTPAGPVEVWAGLVVGADGRNSAVRDCAGLIVDEVGAPMDVLWMRLSKRAGDPELLAHSDCGRRWCCSIEAATGSAAFRFPRESRGKCRQKESRNFERGLFTWRRSCGTA